MSKFTECLLDTLTGRPAKGFSRSELNAERLAQLQAVIWGLISVVAGWALMTGIFHAMAFYATH